MNITETEIDELIELKKIQLQDKETLKRFCESEEGTYIYIKEKNDSNTKIGGIGLKIDKLVVAVKKPFKSYTISLDQFVQNCSYNLEKKDIHIVKSQEILKLMPKINLIERKIAENYCDNAQYATGILFNPNDARKLFESTISYANKIFASRILKNTEKFRVNTLGEITSEIFIIAPVFDDFNGVDYDIKGLIVKDFSKELYPETLDRILYNISDKTSRKAWPYSVQDKYIPIENNSRNLEIIKRNTHYILKPNSVSLNVVKLDEKIRIYEKEINITILNSNPPTY
ncbi:MAG: hypothetical protein WC916_01085 [Candidatus Woesearchaeota archaeon]